ncbi:codeine O-demethylase-like [Silene latifolia]|uniref:codeine O-demethylase-like n=1 Tax=Silene latifolia TaxID=37657 RepID=UPI003D786AD5
MKTHITPNLTTYLHCPLAPTVEYRLLQPSALLAAIAHAPLPVLSSLSNSLCLYLWLPRRSPAMLSQPLLSLLVNHGITSSKLDQVIQVCKDFFALPVEEKQKYIQVPGQLEGWGGDTMSKDQNLNWNNRFLLFIYPVEQRNPKFWPDESLSKFREIVEDYAAELRKIFKVVCKAISKLLNLEEDNVLNKYAKDGIMGFRVNHYPSCPFPDKVVGLKAHSDVHLLTFLLQDKEVEGLHVEKDGQWYKVPIVPGALVINTADMLEILTNGKVKSVYHRAVVDGTRERISLACGFGPPQNTKIGPLNELITEETPKLYKTDSNYVMTAVSNYALGNRTIDTMKIHRSSNI